MNTKIIQKQKGSIALIVLVSILIVLLLVLLVVVSQLPTFQTAKNSGNFYSILQNYLQNFWDYQLANLK